jgi:glutaredoxin
MHVPFLSRLLKRLRGRSAARAKRLQIVVYTRRGCHLCDVVLGQLQSLHHEFEFDVDEIDVDTDGALRESYGDQVPIVIINGKIRFRGRVNEVLLKRMLRAETCRRRQAR